MLAILDLSSILIVMTKPKTSKYDGKNEKTIHNGNIVCSDSDSDLAAESIDMSKIASWLSLALVVSLSGCTSMFEVPPPAHFYEGPERPLTELAFLTSPVDGGGLIHVNTVRVDGRKRSGTVSQYLLPGEHVVTFQWHQSLVRKRTADLTVSFEAGKSYRALHALLAFAPEDAGCGNAYVFAWIVDELNYVVAGYRPRQLADRLVTELPHGNCRGTDPVSRRPAEHLLDENRDEEQKGYEHWPSLFGG